MLLLLIEDDPALQPMTLGNTVGTRSHSSQPWSEAVTL